MSAGGNKLRGIKRFKATVLIGLLLVSIALLLMVAIGPKPVRAWITNTSSSGDTYVDSSTPDINLNNGPVGSPPARMYVGRYIGAERSYIKFNLSGQLPEGTFARAELHLYCYSVTAGGTEVQIHALRNDNWVETTLTWNIAQASYLPEEMVAGPINMSVGGGSTGPTGGDGAGWYSWDVTSYVQEQVMADNVVSFVGISPTENTVATSVNISVHDGSTPQYCPILRIMLENYMVDISVLPADQIRSALPLGTLTYPVTVANNGILSDTYDLGIADQYGWGPTVSPASLSINSGETASATVSVTLPFSARYSDQMIVTATSRAKPSVSDSEYLYAYAGLLPTGDSYVVENAENSNYGSRPYLYVGSESAGYKTERSFLKFDLSGISLASDTQVKLNLYDFYAGGNVQCREVENDDWSEWTITWRDQPHPEGGTDVLGTIDIGVSKKWYEIDVTSWVQSQYSDDKVASFGLRADAEHQSPGWSAAFDSKDATGIYAGDCPYLEFISAHKVEVNFPSYEGYKWNAPGNTLTYTAWINNIGGNPDTYDLSVGDVKGWTYVLDKYVVGPIDPDAGENVTLTVTIPSSAIPPAEDTITVTARSQANPSVTGSDKCIAQAFIGIANWPTDDTYVTDNMLEPPNHGTASHLYTGRYFTTWENAYLKFNISNVPENETIKKAELWMWCYDTYPYSGTNLYLGACRVDNDNWSETGVTWNSHPDFGSVLNTIHVTVHDNWYKWDVTDFVKEQRGVDNLVSLLVRAPADCPVDRSASFNSKESLYSNEFPFLKISYLSPPGVNVEVSLSSQDNVPGGTLRYTVTVTNTGGDSDTYTLTEIDNAVPSWSPTLSPTSLAVPFEESRTATLSVTIPLGTAAGIQDKITVTATSQTYPAVKDNASCIAHAVALVRGVDVSISPTPQSGILGSLITYTVNVKNMGNVPDTYTLDKTDSAGWTTSLSKTSVGPLSDNASENVTLRVTVPENALEDTRDYVTVKATSQADNTVTDNAICTARAIRENRRGVTVLISPGYRENENGGSLRYTVTVTNTGNVTEDYNLSKTDTRGWNLTLSSPVAGVVPTEDRQVTLTVGIPAIAEDNTSDNITVTATSSENTAIKASASCTARCVKGGVTSLTISPSQFALYPGYSGQVQSLTATLRAGNNPLQDKTITWSVVSGSVNPSSGTTDAVGQVSVVYTAPTVTVETSQVTITASFAGDTQYRASSGTSLGIPAFLNVTIPAPTGGNIVIPIVRDNVITNDNVNLLSVPPNALSENTTFNVVQKPIEAPAGYAGVSYVFSIGPSGTTFATPSTLTLPYDESKIPTGVSEGNLAIYRRTSAGGGWELVGGDVDKTANTISVQINHLSEYAVMVSVGGDGLPLLPIAVVIVVIVIIAIIAVFMRRR